MKILFLTLSRSFSAPDFINQRGIYTDLLREFRSHGHQICVVAPVEKRDKQSTQLISGDGIHLLRVRTGNIRNANPITKGISTILLERQYVRAIQGHFSDIVFDLILFSTPPITFEKVVNYVKKRDNAQAYLLLKDIFPQNAVDLGFFSKKNPLYFYFRRKEIRLYQSADYIGCMSPANVEYIKTHNPYWGDKPVEVCPNSIQPITSFITEEEKKIIRAKYHLPDDATVFLFGGNLGKPQGLGSLLDVIVASQEIKNVFFFIVGQGTEFEKINSWFLRNKPNNAKLLPAVPKDDYDRLLQAADVGMVFLDRRFTIPNFPSRLLPYLECSKPVIAATDVNTDLGKIMMDNGFGLWCENGDLESFIENVKRLANDRDLIDKMGTKGRKFLEDNYLVSGAYETIMKHFKLGVDNV